MIYTMYGYYVVGGGGGAAVYSLSPLNRPMYNDMTSIYTAEVLLLKCCCCRCYCCVLLAVYSRETANELALPPHLHPYEMAETALFDAVPTIKLNECCCLAYVACCGARLKGWSTVPI